MAAEDHLPSVQAVADLVRARTRDDLGQEIGTFDETTRPTAESVSRLIAQEAAIVVLRTGDLQALECPDAEGIRLAASSVIAKRVAAIIEASYRPDEVAEGRTVADFYEGDAAEDLKALGDASSSCRAWQPDDGDGGGTAGGLAPRWHFPRSGAPL